MSSHAAGVPRPLCRLPSVATGRVLSSLLYEVSPLDPLALPAAPLLLASAALLATWSPARRAAWADPLVALRHEWRRWLRSASRSRDWQPPHTKLQV